MKINRKQFIQFLHEENIKIKERISLLETLVDTSIPKENLSEISFEICDLRNRKSSNQRKIDSKYSLIELSNEEIEHFDNLANQLIDMKTNL